jgi:aspartate/methionine/tyrosine aminotransferase
MRNISSVRSKSMGSASSIQQNELVYKKIRGGHDPIILSYGEAPFKVPEITLDSAYWDIGCHYTDGLGHPSFRREISDYEARVHSVVADPDKNILVSAGSKIISYFICLAYLNPGEKILLHEPSWVSYQEHARLCEGTTVFVNYDAGLEDIKQKIRDDQKIRIIYLNNPNNPRGHVYQEDELLELAVFCQARSVILAIDESYSDFVIRERFFSCGKLINDYSCVIVFNSMSKNFGLSGWRLGYCLANQESILTLNRFNQHLITCAPTCLQLSLVGKLSSMADIIRPQILALDSKRDEVCKLLKNRELSYLDGSSTFYIFIDISEKIKDTKQFVLDLLDEDNISLIPGGAYGESTSGFLRLSFAIEPIERIEKALDILASRLEKIGGQKSEL